MTATAIEPTVVDLSGVRYRMQQVIIEADRATLVDAPVYLAEKTTTDDEALGAFQRVLGHLYEERPGEVWVLLAPGGRLVGAF